MPSFLFNKWYEEDVTFWNEGNAIRKDGGITHREKTSEVTLKVFIINVGSMFFWDNNGRFNADGLIFQVSKYELENNSFEIKDGSTHIVYKEKTYRVVNSYDYKDFTFTGLIECKCVRIIDAY